ncbi:MAG: EamA family transporter RarD [Pseudomonadota bacterium]
MREDEQGRIGGIDQIGLIAALSAFTIWGLGPLYWALLAGVPAVDVLAHRAIWSAVLIGGFCVISGRGAKVRAALANRRVLAGLGASGLFIAFNWGLFIWAIQNGFALEASLGYYVYPLVAVALGRIALAEELSQRKQVAVALAALSVLLLTAGLGAAPWIAIALALSFGCYGLIRKVLDVGPITGVFIESALLIPLAFVWLWAYPTTLRSEVPVETVALLVIGGLYTAAPLMLFSEAAKRMPLSTLGVLQYLNPTLQFACAVFVFGEAFTVWHAAAFCGIWCALALYSTDLVRRSKPTVAK